MRAATVGKNSKSSGLGFPGVVYSHYSCPGMWAMDMKRRAKEPGVLR
ncbi:MAG: hypothetical protein JRJ12_13620 [Deltaproteobacteria bacterium]|nr:hypothetical protein [Deltaproteobacteria bacterium]MBW2070785.1 hypothetical protein [Deltaproteobacteria bacterium]